MAAAVVPQAGRPRVLCVDDDSSVLRGLSLVLHSRYDVLTATSGAAALELLAGDRSTAVIVSDMRMPRMDGAAFLGRARRVVPDATRLLLTGQADTDSAVAAVNEGQIFRFLTKPCPPATLHAAVESAVLQHRLVTSERVLLEQTLHGSIKALTEVLALTSPVAFGRANHVKQLVTELAGAVGLSSLWQVEVAAMLSQIGAIILPSETVERLYYGRELSSEEQEMVARAPAVTEQLLGSIPRLEVVREILATSGAPFVRSPPGSEVPLGTRSAQVLRVALDFDALESRGDAPEVAISMMRSRAGRYDPDLLTALTALRAAGGLHDDVREVSLAGLQVGMVLVQDLVMSTGTLLVAKGFEVTPSFLARARNYRAGTVREPLRVILRGVHPAAVR